MNASDAGIAEIPLVSTATSDKMRALMRRSPDERREMGLRGRDHVTAHHSYPVLARRFIDALGARA